MPDPLADRVAAELRGRGPLTAPELAGSLGVPVGVVAAALDRLRTRRAVVRLGGRFVPDAAGRPRRVSVWALLSG